MSESRDRAIVIGASMAGLLAARVLTETYDRVILLDRDQLPDGPVPRGGVPHSLHAHGVLARGREVFDELFPGLVADLESAGAVVGDLQADGRWYFAGDALAAGPSRLRAIAVSRPALEHEVRRRVAALPGIRIESGRVVERLVFDPSTGRVTGVDVRGAGENGPINRVFVDLVVDASGRNSKTPQWIAEHGFSPPPVDKIRVDVSYTTRHFRHTPGSAGGNVAVVVAGSANNSRGGALLRQEGDRWILTLGGYHGERAPAELDEFRAQAELRCPEFAEIARDAEPLDDGRYFRFPASTRRRYEKLRRFPERLVVIGDAVCSFNPVFGQGMTVAAVEALALRDCLSDGVDRLGRRFFAAIKPAVDVPWQIAAGADLSLPETPGRPPLPGRLINRYVARLQRAGQRDPKLATVFLRVANLKASPPTMFRPDRVLRVLLRGRPAPATPVTSTEPAGGPAIPTPDPQRFAPTPNERHAS